MARPPLLRQGGDYALPAQVPLRNWTARPSYALSGCGSRVVGVFQGYAKNAYPWLIYLHRSAVRSLHACLTMWTGQMQMNNAGKRAVTRWLAAATIMLATLLSYIDRQVLAVL